VNASLITGLNGPEGIVMTAAAIPEPSAFVMMGFGSAVLLFVALRRRTNA